jgi:uncharacterized membrane protein
MHRLPLLHAAPRRWLVALTAGACTQAALQWGWQASGLTAFLVAWNVAVLMEVGWLVAHACSALPGQVRRRVVRDDDGPVLMVLMVLACSVVLLVAIGSQVQAAKAMTGWPKVLHLGLAGLTLASSWLFTQSAMALRYAHLYYARCTAGQEPGLMFPGAQPPDELDFFYFSAVIGTSGQTADVSFTAAPMRRIGLLHCMHAYLFNTVVLALSINLGASLI